MYEGFYKVEEEGGCFRLAILYNPETGEQLCKVARDDDDPRNEEPGVRNMPIDRLARRIWLHRKGEILEGDIVQVVKGRKLPIGKQGRVKAVRTIRDKYQRPVADYVFFEDGTSTNVNNCILQQAIDDYVPEWMRIWDEEENTREEA